MLYHLGLSEHGIVLLNGTVAGIDAVPLALKIEAVEVLHVERITGSTVEMALLSLLTAMHLRSSMSYLMRASSLSAA